MWKPPPRYAQTAIDRPSGACTGRVGSRSAGVIATASPPLRGIDHSTLCTSATNRSPPGASDPAPFVAPVNPSTSRPTRGAATASAAPTGTPTATPASAAVPAAACRKPRRERAEWVEKVVSSVSNFPPASGELCGAEAHA